MAKITVAATHLLEMCRKARAELERRAPPARSNYSYQDPEALSHAECLSALEKRAAKAESLAGDGMGYLSLEDMEEYTLTELLVRGRKA